MTKKFLLLFMTTCLTTVSLMAIPQAVVFDFGGVMTGEPKREVVVQFLSSTLGLSEEELEKVRLEKKEATKAGKSDEEFWLSLAEQKGISLPENWSQAFQAAMKEAIGINPEMYALVAELKAKNIPVALLSNIDKRLAHIVRTCGLYEPFNPCLLSYELGVEKPDPQIYALLLEQVHFPAQDILFIDDKQENIDAAKQAGLDALLFHSPTHLREELAKRGISA